MGLARQRSIIALICILPVFASFFVGLRLIARWRRRIKYDWDDWLLIAATLLSFGLIGPSVKDIKGNSIGYHVWEIRATSADLTNPDFGEHYGILLSLNLISIPILPLAKASIVLLLLKIGRILPLLRRYLYAAFVFNAGSCLGPWIAYIFICPPATGNTSAPRTFGNLHCISRDGQGRLLLFVNSANLATDIMILPVPFFIMRELMNKTWRSRITILMTFASSLVVTALSAMKVYLTWRDRILMIPDPDWTYSLDFCITHGEAVTGIIVACLPTLRGLLSRGLGLSNTGGENSSTGYYRSLHQQSHSLHMSRTAGRRTGNTTTISSPGAMETGGANNEEYLLKPHDVIVTTVVEARRDSPTEETERHSVKDIDQASGTSTSDLIIQGTDVKGNTPSPIPPFPRAHLQDRTRSRRTSQGGWS